MRKLISMLSDRWMPLSHAGWHLGLKQIFTLSVSENPGDLARPDRQRSFSPLPSLSLFDLTSQFDILTPAVLISVCQTHQFINSSFKEINTGVVHQIVLCFFLVESHGANDRCPVGVALEAAAPGIMGLCWRVPVCPRKQKWEVDLNKCRGWKLKKGWKWCFPVTFYFSLDFLSHLGAGGGLFPQFLFSVFSRS